MNLVSETQLFVDAIFNDPRNLLSVNITGLSSDDFSFSVGKNSSSLLILSFDYRREIPKDTVITITVVKKEWMLINIEEILNLYTFSLIFPTNLTLCPRGFIRNSGKKEYLFCIKFFQKKNPILTFNHIFSHRKL